jgi:hypothetical protein
MILGWFPQISRWCRQAHHTFSRCAKRKINLVLVPILQTVHFRCAVAKLNLRISYLTELMPIIKVTYVKVTYVLMWNYFKYVQRDSGFT